MPDTGRRQRPCQLCALRRCGDSEPLAQPAASRVDPELPTGLRIHQIEEPDIRELLFAWIANLDSDDVVMPGESEERASPVALAPKVGDDHDERARRSSEGRQRDPSYPAPRRRARFEER